MCGAGVTDSACTAELTKTLAIRNQVKLANLPLVQHVACFEAGMKLLHWGHRPPTHTKVHGVRFKAFASSSISSAMVRRKSEKVGKHA